MLKRFSMKGALNGALFGGFIAGVATYFGESMLWWLVMPAAAIACAFPGSVGEGSSSPTWSSSSSGDSPTWGDSSGGGDSGGGGGGDGG